VALAQLPLEDLMMLKVITPTPMSSILTIYSSKK